MDLSRLNFLLKQEPAYRLKQVKRAISKDLISNWSEATTIPQDLRRRLERGCPLYIQAKTYISSSGDSIKALITLHDNVKIESVLMRHKDKRNTVCVSSQVGCPLKCTFCATGRMGFKRNLNPSEIIEQVIFFARLLRMEAKKVTNIVFMGMGEPFLNYDNVIEAIRILNDKEGFALGARHFSVSTVGITEGIRKLAQEKLQVNLAISLHAPTNDLRIKLMPINKQYPIENVMSAADYYISKTNRKVMFEYILIKDVNDSLAFAEKLGKLLQDKLCVVNLIPCNPMDKVRPSSQVRLEKFKRILEGSGIPVVQRYSFGQDIHAACGQLAGRETIKY
jgi:23S rRNA (adenine2503-C2)-methyltransferase